MPPRASSAACQPAFPPLSPALQPCGGAIPICMVEEFDLPMEIIDRRVTKMKMISPSNREVDVGKTLNEKEWIGMCRREVRSPPRTQAGGSHSRPLPYRTAMSAEGARGIGMRCCLVRSSSTSSGRQTACPCTAPACQPAWHHLSVSVFISQLACGAAHPHAVLTPRPLCPRPAPRCLTTSCASAPTSWAPTW